MSHYAGTALWLLVTMTTAIGSYTVNLKVAATRSEVANLREALVRDARAIRNLQAELRTRARLPEMQRWNDSVLKMSAPAAGQYLASPLVLASFVPAPGIPAPDAAAPRYAVTGPAPMPAAPGIVTASYRAPGAGAAAAASAKPAVRQIPVAGTVRQIAFTPDRPTGALARDPRTLTPREPKAAEVLGGGPSPDLRAISARARATTNSWTQSRPLATPISAPIDLLPPGAR